MHKTIQNITNSLKVHEKYHHEITRLNEDVPVKTILITRGMETSAWH